MNHNPHHDNRIVWVHDPAVAEAIRQQAAEDNLTLPYPAEFIAAVERVGGWVDLLTGEVHFPEQPGPDAVIIPVLGQAYTIATRDETRPTGASNA